MKKRLITIMLISSMLLTGCNNTDNANNSVIEKNNNNEVIEQFYDKSRLEEITYNFENATKNFSFKTIEYKEVEVGDYSYTEEEPVIYSFTSTDKVKFAKMYDYNSHYTFEYRLSEDNVVNVTLTTSEFKKDNYLEVINEYRDSSEYPINYEIIYETESYFVYKLVRDYETEYYAVKFFENGYSLKIRYSDYNELDVTQDIMLNVAEDFYNTISEDNGDALLEDKIASIKNYQGRKLKSSKYIMNIEVDTKTYHLYNNDINAFVSFNQAMSYSDKWKNLSSGDPYINISDEKEYKVIKNGLPEYYRFVNYDAIDDEKLGGTLEDLDSLINKFYK